MVWESEPLDAVAARPEERGVSSVVFEPCGHVPAEGDYLSVMRSNLDRLESASPAAGGA